MVPNSLPKGRRQRLIFGFGALLILAMLFAAIVGNAMSTAALRRQAQGWYVHTLEVLLAAEALKGAANTAIRGERGYLITANPAFLQRSYRIGRENSARLVDELAAQTRDNPEQRRNLVELRKRIASYFGVLDRATALRRTGQEAAATAIVRSSTDAREIDAALAQVGAIEQEERRLLALRARINDAAISASERNDYALAAVGLIFLAIAGMAGISAMRSQALARRVTEQLRRSATTDELTGLANRRAFMHSLEVEVARARRSGAPLSVAIVDLDHFKRINDAHGHGGGDEVLRRLARIADEMMRTSDVVARLGGEEFGILMPDTDQDAARIACERLRSAVAAESISMPSGGVAGVTLSTGIALLVPGEERERLVSRADHALYRAKEAGRNQVRLAA